MTKKGDRPVPTYGSKVVCEGSLKKRKRRLDAWDDVYVGIDYDRFEIYYGATNPPNHGDKCIPLASATVYIPPFGQRLLGQSWAFEIGSDDRYFYFSMPVGEGKSAKTLFKEESIKFHLNKQPAPLPNLFLRNEIAGMLVFNTTT